MVKRWMFNMHVPIPKPSWSENNKLSATSLIYPYQKQWNWSRLNKSKDPQKIPLQSLGMGWKPFFKPTNQCTTIKHTNELRD